MVWHHDEIYGGDLQSPAKARAFAASSLATVLGAGAAGVVRDAALIVSELVTNAVRAGGRAIRVELAVDGDMVRIGVTDDAGGWPTVRQAQADDISGRGLLLVTALAREWGVHARSGGGKRVWVSLAVVPDGVAQMAM